MGVEFLTLPVSLTAAAEGSKNRPVEFRIFFVCCWPFCFFVRMGVEFLTLPVSLTAAAEGSKNRAR